MISLVPFTVEDFPMFKSWVRSEQELFQFAGTIFKYPLSDENLTTYINDKRRIPYKVIRSGSGEPVGHCELNFENERPRLSRILVAHEHLRGQGIGKMIVAQMLHKLFVEYNFTSADLNVFEWNITAIKCYEKMGFKINPNVFSLQGEWKAINMVIDK
jgi:RimJ/RimL family protein N-acetyltransferase